MGGARNEAKAPDYATAAQRMAEAIQAFLAMPQLREDKRLSKFVGSPQYFDLIVARRRYIDELEGRARSPGDPVNGLHAR